MLESPVVKASTPEPRPSVNSLSMLPRLCNLALLLKSCAHGSNGPMIPRIRLKTLHQAMVDSHQAAVN